jgi:uridine kinase
VCGWVAAPQVDPAKVIILEGILVLHIPELREQCSMRIFVDTGALRGIIQRLSQWIRLKLTQVCVFTAKAAGQ